MTDHFLKYLYKNNITKFFFHFFWVEGTTLIAKYVSVVAKAPPTNAKCVFT